jgi:hypothetical protein
MPGAGGGRQLVGSIEHMFESSDNTAPKARMTSVQPGAVDLRGAHA